MPPMTGPAIQAFDGSDDDESGVDEEVESEEESDANVAIAESATTFEVFWWMQFLKPPLRLESNTTPMQFLSDFAHVSMQDVRFWLCKKVMFVPVLTWPQ
jgi:hypothetical protein